MNKRRERETSSPRFEAAPGGLLGDREAKRREIDPDGFGWRSGLLLRVREERAERRCGLERSSGSSFYRVERG
jgi:hypothetical protein